MWVVVGVLIGVVFGRIASARDQQVPRDAIGPVPRTRADEVAVQLEKLQQRMQP